MAGGTEVQTSLWTQAPWISALVIEPWRAFKKKVELKYKAL